MTNAPISDPYKINPYQWPIINPGNSWAVPRIAMPQFFSIQWAFAIDSWYYIGHGIDDQENEYSLNVIVGRYALRGRNPFPQMTYLAIGIGSHAENKFYSSFGYGLDVSDDVTRPAALILPPVTDFSFDILFTPLLNTARGRIRYTGGAPVGIAQAQYRIDCTGDTEKISGKDPDKLGLKLGLSLELLDERGTVLEGASGCVAPMKDDEQGVYTYEVAQPRLTIKEGSTLTINGRSVRLAGGSLWHDRQAYTFSPYAGAGLLLSGHGSPDELVKAGGAKAGNLYRGMWIAIKLDNGISMLISPQWNVLPKGEQWISGRAVGRPPAGGYGNLFFPVDPKNPYSSRHNGGALLSGGTITPGEPPVAGDDWDFDVNIFDPKSPQDSPHAAGPSKNVYATKWSVKFSDEVASWGVPKEFYMVALVDVCENTLAGSNPFSEGAVRICSDAACSQRIGYGFVEQMGYN
jgi:hypothetical protein